MGLSVLSRVVLTGQTSPESPSIRGTMAILLYSDRSNIRSPGCTAPESIQIDQLHPSVNHPSIHPHHRSSSSSSSHLISSSFTGRTPFHPSMTQISCTIPVACRSPRRGGIFPPQGTSPTCRQGPTLARLLNPAFPHPNNQAPISAN